MSWKAYGVPNALSRAPKDLRKCTCAGYAHYAPVTAFLPSSSMATRPESEKQLEIFHDGNFFRLSSRIRQNTHTWPMHSLVEASRWGRAFDRGTLEENVCVCCLLTPFIVYPSRLVPHF